jgi:hypothetical protein
VSQYAGLALGFEIATPKNCHFKPFLLGHHWFLEEGVVADLLEPSA